MRLLTVLIILVALVPVVQAEEITTITGFQIEGNCVNTTHLNKTIPIYLDGVPITMEAGPTFCPFGCVENATQYGDDCRDRDPLKTAMSGGFLLVVSVIFLFMANKAQRPLDIMFSFMALFTLISSLLVGSLVTVIHYPGIASIFDTVYLMAILSIMPIFAWFMFGILRDFVASMKKVKKIT